MNQGDLVKWAYGPNRDVLYVVLLISSRIDTPVLCKIFGSNGRMCVVNELQLVKIV